MNIIHLISGGDVGGAKTHVLSLLAGLKETENVRLVCFTDGEFADEARELGIDTVIVDCGVAAAIGEVARIVRDHKAQVIHCHGARANMIGALLRKKVHVPVVTTVHSDYRLDYLGRPVGRLTYGTINTIALRFMDYYVGVSDPMAELLISRGFDPQRIYAIYNGVDFTPRQPKMSREEYLHSVGLDNCENCVVYGIAARLSAVKDVATLIRGFGLAAQKCENIRLVIAGDGEEREMLTKLAQQCCPEGTYAFCGWVSDMDSFYGALDVNTLTSLSETFPYALTEGARMHCATIASRVGGVPRLIEDGVCGCLFDAKDYEKLAEHIVLLAQNDELRRRLGEALYEKASRDFSVEATVRRQKEIYETVLRKQERKTRKRDGIMICGAYGRDNAGDDAILESIVGQMRQLDEDVPMYVLTRKPRQTAMRYRIGTVHTLDFGKFCRVCKKTQLYINGGGSLIQDATSSRSLWYYLLNIATAKRRGNRVLMYGCGIGPVTCGKNRKMAGKVIDRYSDIVTLREDLSLRELRDMGVTQPEMKITADPAILLKPAQDTVVDNVLQTMGIKPQEAFAVFAPRPWKGEEKPEVFAAVAKYTQKKYGLRPVFLAMEPHRDMEICRQAADLTGADALCVAAPAESTVLIGILQRAKLVTAMRLHALIFAAGVGTPLVGVAYDPKVTGFMEYIGNAGCLQLETLQEEALTAAVDEALGGGFDYAEMANRLQALAEENKEAARRLLEEEK